MKKWLISFAVIAAVVFLAGPTARPTYAFLEYFKGFKAKYTKPSTPYVELVDKTKCNICHAGTSKKNRNDYGKALSKLLTPADKKNVEKINKSLDEVAKQHSDPAKADSPTYGELIDQGKLPYGSK